MGVIDRSPFYGSRVPVEFGPLIKNLKGLDSATFRKLLQVSVKLLEGFALEDGLSALLTDKLDEETANVTVTGLYTLLRAAIRLPVVSLKQELFKEDCKELKIADDQINDLAQVVYGPKRAALDQKVFESRDHAFPSLKRFKWRTDVAISTTSLNRSLKPHVLMQMVTSDNKVNTFEVSMEKFAELRYHVAFVLKEMDTYEKKQVLQIKD
eukprot:Colp12_sorted_trinity150504_noHs@5504